MVQELPRRTLRGPAVSAGLAVSAALAALLLGACRGEARPSSEDAALTRLIDSVRPELERATGLSFRRRPRAYLIDRSQLAAFLAAQNAKQFGEGKGGHLASTYRLLGLVPDSIDLMKMLSGVLTEQVAGFYLPDSGAFYGVLGSNRLSLRTTVTHELVHALQDDHLDLAAFERIQDSSDRQLAIKAVLEGHATLIMTLLNPEAHDQALSPGFWETARVQAEEQLRGMPELAAAPRIVRDNFLFQYFGGAEYVRWWISTHPGTTLPPDSMMPRSTEQVLKLGRDPDDRPVAVRLVGGQAPVFQDQLGAVGLQILLAEAKGGAALMDPAILGWGGDQVALYSDHGPDALVWIAVFDTPRARDGAMRTLADWPRPRPGYRRQLDSIVVSGKLGLRLTVAPTDWGRWSALPTATAEREP